MKNTLKWELIGNFIFMKINEKTNLVVSMMFSTMLTCFLIQFLPALMPVWMHFATSFPIKRT